MANRKKSPPPERAKVRLHILLSAEVYDMLAAMCSKDNRPLSRQVEESVKLSFEARANA